MDPDRISERTSDYSIEYFRDKKGRLKKRSVYNGPDFYYVLPEEIRKKAVILLGGLTASAFVFTMIPLLMANELMHKWYTSLPFIVCLFADIHLVMGLVCYLRSSEPLKRDEVKAEFERLAIWSLFDMIFSFTSFVGQIIWHVKNGFLAADTVITVSTLLLFICSVMIFRAKGFAETVENKAPDRH